VVRQAYGAWMTQRINKTLSFAHDNDCFFLREYTAGVGYEHGETNNLIMSLLLIHAICRTHPAHPVQSAEAGPGAGNKLR
jgi:hypothetical protein